MPSHEFTTAPPRATSDGPPPASPVHFDPLRYCIFTTIALLAWLIGPAPMVVLMSGVGLVAYWRAWRAGLVKSRCILGDTRLVMLYLAVVFVTAAVATGYHWRFPNGAP